jgi:hypothetical protein
MIKVKKNNEHNETTIPAPNGRSNLYDKKKEINIPTIPVNHERRSLFFKL